MAQTGNPTIGGSQQGPDFTHVMDHPRNPKFALYIGVAAAFIAGAVALLLALG